jgi:hypothetical protein
MQSQIQRFLLALDGARIKTSRMIYSDALDPSEIAALSCINSNTIIQDTHDFLASVRFDRSLRAQPATPLQSNLVVEAKEILELLNSAYIYAYDLLEFENMGPIATQKLEKVIACMAGMIRVLPSFIDTWIQRRQTKQRPVYAIISHGDLCNDYTFTVPRGCTVVVLTPPGGQAFAEISRKMNGYKEKFNGKFVNKIRNEANLGFYSAHYHEGSAMHDQILEFTDPTIFNGMYELPLSSRPRNLMPTGVKSVRLSSLVGSLGPGIYVIQACRTTSDMVDWKNAMKRDVRAQGGKKLPDAYNICRKNMSMKGCREIAKIPMYEAFLRGI